MAQGKKFKCNAEHSIFIVMLGVLVLIVVMLNIMVLPQV